ncbi:MAG: hypothetical protein JRF18_05395, partial [Deltaproteobacteria bacterium]|nr:hypothetical protein [Deltaproteobacteria bacterium]
MKVQSTKKIKRACTAVALPVILTLILCALLANTSYAATAKEIDTSVDVALERFYNDVKGGKEFLKNA